MKKYDVIVIGSGLAGLSAALELSERGKSVVVLEKQSFLGGRTASWNEERMLVESGFHRHIGYYEALPKLLQKAGVDIQQIVQWEESVDIRIKETKKTVEVGISPLFAPIRTIGRFIWRNDLFSFKDKVALMRMFVAGFFDYKTHADKLDEYSIKEYAQRYKIAEHVFQHLLIPLSTGLFFMPPEKYSAKMFFGLFYPALLAFYKFRIGAYLGGMTEVIANPIAQKIEQYGGEVRKQAFVQQVMVEDGTVQGVKLQDGTIIHASNVIVATSLGRAKKLLRAYENEPSFANLFALPTIPAVTIQMEFSQPVLPYDRTTFGPLTSLASFTEQSRSTFTHVPGRVSLILAPPEKFITMEPSHILAHVQQEAKDLGLDLTTHLTDYRVVKYMEDFYYFAPHYDHLRPTQKTVVDGLILAGDYTRQPFFSTMEGAVVSGMRAANEIG